jgi:hypothetical protein
MRHVLDIAYFDNACLDIACTRVISAHALRNAYTRFPDLSSCARCRRAVRRRCAGRAPHKLRNVEISAETSLY